MHGYRFGRELGYGMNSSVLSATDSHDRRVAIKKLKLPMCALQILREIRLLQYLKHPCIVKCLDVLNHEGVVCIVLERYDIDLREVLLSDQKLETSHTRYIILQILRGIAHMHALNVIHRDVKPANILLKKDCTTVLGDFGLARWVPAIVNEQNMMLTDNVVTRWYRAPEVLMGKSYGKAIDVWSVGCILAEFAIRKTLFPSHDDDEQLELIVDLLGTPRDLAISKPSLPDCEPRSFEQLFGHHLDAHGIDLLKSMLQFDPDQRITAADALKHPYFHSGSETAPDPTPSPPVNAETWFAFELEDWSADKMFAACLTAEDLESSKQ